MDVLGSEAGMARAGKPEQLARALAAEVRTLPEGAALPSENALAGRFGVSRVVVREAVARLLELLPEHRAGQAGAALPFGSPALAEAYVALLAAAGLPR